MKEGARAVVALPRRRHQPRLQWLTKRVEHGFSRASGTGPADVAMGSLPHRRQVCLLPRWVPC